ncbi:PREDICTED: leucine-rich repeats and immunoglobulin-like domains protein 1 [Nicrophorus vespilloides]|uniref:Leucine-rich repeats and immunoglobulin-like domains protein 1 n=1 Tax=Nicrophorus vespilloides TaxID=110193 RepID=A0ABM1N7S6_NICVS|nr:PREDICTED: leucine-rich repeats and immunoglobulin-like domains protein 1 [Nicrophorus vespilloides]
MYTNIGETQKLKPFSIKILILTSNDIQNISRAIKGLKIERLNINENIITELKTGMFEEKKSFRTVSLVNNQINVLQRKSIPMALYLYLNNNLIKSLNADMFINISYVQSLYLNNNCLKKITVSSLMGLKAIILELSHNQLEDLEDRSIPEVEKLFMNNNKLTSINSKMFVNISHLSILELSYNKITEITNCKINNSNLSILKLSHNKISHIVQASFEGMQMLKNLSLTNNLITSMEMNSIPIVEYLDLSYNLLTSIEENMFSDVYYLESVDIRYNCIKETDLKLMEQVLILNQKFNEKCSTHITKMDIFLILNSAVFVVLVIVAIVITVYTRRFTKFSKHFTNSDWAYNAQLFYGKDGRNIIIIG